MLIKSEQEMMNYGKKLGRDILAQKKFPIVIELLGDVGAGKTTFTRGLAKGLGVQAELSSPSFTISRVYAGDGCILSHYDFYRLGDPGLMVEDLAESIAEDNSITVIEWGQSISDILPENHIKITITYIDEKTRKLDKR